MKYLKYRPVRLFLLFLLAVSIWYLLSDKEIKQKAKVKPVKIDTSDYSMTELSASLDKNPAMPDRMDGQMLSIKPLETRSKWNSSLSILIISAEDKTPVSGVRVYLKGPIDLPSAWSDQDGNVNFHKLPKGEYIVWLVHDKYAMESDFARQSIELQDNKHLEIFLEMHQSCVVSGRIIDAKTSLPVDGARIFPNRYEDNEPVFSDSDGKFSVSSGEIDFVDIYIQMDGFSPQDIRLGCRAGMNKLGDIVLTRSWKLVGHVMDEDGNPLNSVEVRDYPKQSSHRGTGESQNVIITRTNSAGLFEMTGLPTTNELIYFYKKGYASTSAMVNPTTPKNFEVRMFKACTLSGRVIDQNQTAVEGVSLMVLKGGWEQSSNSISDKDGKFSLTLEPGHNDLWLIYSETGGQLRKRVTVDCKYDNQPLELVIQRASEQFSSGTVFDAAGNTQANAFVHISNYKSGNSKAEKFSMRYVTSDSEGHFKIAVPNSKYSLFAFSMKTSSFGALKDLQEARENLEIKLEQRKRMSSDSANEGHVETLTGEAIIDYTYCWSSCQKVIAASPTGKWHKNSGHPMDFPPLFVFLPDGRIGKMSDYKATKVIVGEGAMLLGRFGNDFEGLTTVQLISSDSHFPRTIKKIIVEDEFNFPLLPTGTYTLRITSASGRRVDINKISIKNGENIDLGEIEL